MISFIYNVILLAAQTVSGSQAPPPPSQNRGPNLPIDDNIWILLVVGILFGAYLIYKRNRSTNKAS